jgi:hypothetical protein
MDSLQKYLSQIDGKILNVDNLDSACIQIISKNILKYRIDTISQSGSSTFYTDENGIKLYTLSSNNLILDVIFGSPKRFIVSELF